jgi:hypothetical protein
VHVGPLRSRLRLCLALIPFAGCVSPTNVNQRMLPFVQTGDFLSAVEVLEDSESAFGEKNAVLYHLERGMLYHYARDFAASNASFEIAKRLAELHFTKSITAEASTFLANDNTRPYYGENFERALIHVFGALNYQALYQVDEALVEIRQVNFLLRQLVVDGEDNTYRDDAFARYLAGMFFEQDGDLDEAWIAYQKSLDAYGVYGEAYGVAAPRSLRRDARRVVAQLGEATEIDFARRYGEEPLEPRPPGTGRVTVVHYNGRAPVKIDTFIDIAVIQGLPYVNKIDVDGEAERDVALASQVLTSALASDVVRIAFPKYREIGRRIRRLEVMPAGGRGPVAAELAEDVGAIAEQDLADRIVRVRAKAIARALVKYALGKLAEQAAREAGGDDYGELAGALARVGSGLARTASEVADKRGWFTVPDQIWICQIDLEEGDHDLRLTFRDEAGQVVSTDAARVVVEAGRQQFLMVRTVE